MSGGDTGESTGPERATERREQNTPMMNDSRFAVERYREGNHG